MIAKLSIVVTLFIASTILAAPLTTSPENTTSIATDLVRRKAGDCGNKHLPKESDYISGVASFCAFYNPTPQNPNPTKIIEKDDPLVGTVRHKAYDNGEDLFWVYKISVSSDGVRLHLGMAVDYNTCMSKMKSLMTEGKLGDDFCVVEGTQDVLFKGAKVRQPPAPERFGSIIYESYKRHGKPPA